MQSARERLNNYWNIFSWYYKEYLWIILTKYKFGSLHPVNTEESLFLYCHSAYICNEINH